MESRRTPPAKAFAAASLVCAVVASVVLACVGCTQNAAGPSGQESSPSSSQTAFIAPEDMLAVQEADFTPPPPPEPEPEPEPEPLRHFPTGSELRGLSGATEPFAFALAEEDEGVALSSASASAIGETVTVFDQADWKSGYLLVDLETGRGIAGNIDERVFGASAIKGPFVHFLCEKWLDTGKASLEDEVTVGEKTMTLKEAVEDAIIKSGNESYKVLFSTYSAGWATWVGELGVGSEFNSHQRNPYYTARESALMWLAAYNYVNAEGDARGQHAQWLSEMLSDTQVSFMRHAIAGGDVTVASKPGWYATPEDSEYDMDSFCEAGIVSEGGHDYLLTVMTDAAYKGTIENAFEDIIQAVWSARHDIAAEE